MQGQSLSAFTVWFIVGLIFLGLLVDYSPRLGALFGLLIVLYLALKLGRQGLLSGSLS